MKYDILEGYREYLSEVLDNRNTVDRYYFAVVKCLKDMQFNALSEVSGESIENYLVNLKGSSNFSALKNGLKHLEKFDSSFKAPEDDFFKRVAKNKRRGTKKGLKVIDLDKVQKKVNALKNKKLKLGYRLMQLSGLRVSELANLKKEDIKIDGQVITVNVRKGKGGKSGQVECDPDQYLSEKLQDYLTEYDNQDYIFYKTETIKRKAKELGIECHDFRRIAAITHRNKMKDAGMSLEEANEDTKEYLRHERFATTKRYLFNRKLKIQSKDKTDTPSWIKKDEFYQQFSEEEKAIYNKACQSEPRITALVSDITQKNGGKLEGLEYRLKTPKSIYEKAYQREEKILVSEMKDLVRYTAIYSPDKLAEATDSSIKEFKKRGYKVYKIKNTWNDDFNPYKGINTVLFGKDNQPFEMQFHTPESWDIKDKMHKMYEEWRVLKETSPEAIKLLEEMFKLSDKLEKPKGIEEVGK